MKKLKVVQVVDVEGHEDADLGWLEGDPEKDWEFFEVDGELYARWVGPPPARQHGAGPPGAGLGLLPGGGRHGPEPPGVPVITFE